MPKFLEENEKNSTPTFQVPLSETNKARNQLNLQFSPP